MRSSSALRAIASCAALGVCIVAAIIPVCGQTFSITDVANSSSSEFTDFDAAPRVNSSGVVSFIANRDLVVGGGQGVYKATNTNSFVTIALNSSPEFNDFFPATINNAGVVAFYANRDTSVGGGNGIYTAIDSSGFITVALTNASGFSSLGSNPYINNAGIVIFGGGRSGVGGLYTAANTSSFSTIALTSSPEFFGFNSSGTLNDSGTAAFLARRDPGVGSGEGIYKAANTSSFTTVALDTSSEFRLFNSFDTIPSINNAGVVAFAAYRDTEVGGGNGIYTATDSSSFTLIARSDTSSEFDVLGDPVINNLGTVAFAANRDASAGGGVGIYAALTGISNPVPIIRTGDALFNSTVSQLFFAQGLATDSNTIAFRYILSNGVTGIARANLSTVATAPEPTSIALVGIGLLSILVRVLKPEKSRFFP